MSSFRLSATRRKTYSISAPKTRSNRTVPNRTWPSLWTYKSARARDKIPLFKHPPSSSPKSEGDRLTSPHYTSVHIALARRTHPHPPVTSLRPNTHPELPHRIFIYAWKYLRCGRRHMAWFGAGKQQNYHFVKTHWINIHLDGIRSHYPNQFGPPLRVTSLRAASPPRPRPQPISFVYCISQNASIACSPHGLTVRAVHECRLLFAVSLILCCTILCAPAVNIM